MKWLLNLKSNNRLKTWTFLRVFIIVQCFLHIRVHLLFIFLMNKAIVCQISERYQVKAKRNYYSSNKKLNHFFHDTYHKTKRSPYLIYIGKKQEDANYSRGISRKILLPLLLQVFLRVVLHTKALSRNYIRFLTVYREDFFSCNLIKIIQIIVTVFVFFR